MELPGPAGARRRARRSATAAVVAALVVAVALVACEPTPYTFTYVGSGRKVAVVGDSITADAQAELQTSLAAYSTAVAGVPSMTLAEGIDARIRPAIASKPDVLVVELGINDALDGWDYSTELRTLERALALLDTATCVVWVTPSALAPSYFDHLGPGTMQARAASFKASLVKRLPKHPKQRLADVSVPQLANPSWFVADHLHSSPEGRVAYAEFVARSVALCP